MNINLNDKLVAELDSIFDNKRTNQVEWDACIEDIVEEYIARHNGTWEDLLYEDEEDDDEDIKLKTCDLFQDKEIRRVFRVVKNN